MTGARVRIQDFKGQYPKVSNRLLENSQARIARNVKLSSGELRGFRNWQQAHNFNDGTIQKAFRLPDDLSPNDELWVGFDNPSVNLYPGPLLNDAFDRYYKFGDGRPQYNTLERLRNGDPYYWLGVPPPVLNGALAATGGTSPDEERFYVYTLVTQYGEEGQPSAPVSATGKEDGTWDYTGLDVSVPNPAEQPVTTKNIYRTVVGFSSVEFFFVDNIPLNQASYSDTNPSDVVARNNLLESENWAIAPVDIDNAVVMPNGFFLAWAGRDIHFSEVYRPWAWPADYDLSVQYEVIGAGVFGQSAGIVTKGHPYFSTGTAPENSTLTKNNTAEPGLSEFSIVSLPYGVLYASQNGLVLMSQNGVTVPTENIITKDEWLNTYSPETMRSAQYEDQYLGFYASDKGVSINPQDQNESFTEFDVFTGVDQVQTDERTGEVYIIRAGVVYLWDSVQEERVSYQWRSKSFYFKKPCNLGAAVVDMESLEDIIADIEAVIEQARIWNAERIQYRLNPMGSAAMGSSYYQPLPPPYDTDPQNRLSLGGSPLIDTQQIITRNSDIQFRVYADGALVYAQQIEDNKMFKLPAGFKRDIWEFEIRGRRTVFSINVAETAKGLADV